jgi:ribosomal protein S27AE
MQSSATSAVNESNYILEHQCPQCGAAVSLSETDRIFTCPFCRVRLIIFFQEFPSLYLPGPPSREQDYFYVPYWRCKGTRYFLTSGGVERSLVDHSFCAVQTPPSLFPLSLGIRSQTLHRKFVEPLSAGVFLAPQTVFASVKETVRHSLARQNEFVKAFTSLYNTETQMAEKQTAAASQPVEAMIGELVSLVYSPFYVSQSFLFDGITSERIAPWPENSMQMLDCRPPGPSFISTLCPECGWGLLAESDSLALVCGKCGRAWSAAARGLAPLDFFLCSTSIAADLWLPFWRLDVAAKSVALGTIADFVRLTKTPRPVFPAMEQQKFYFWMPAFKANPNLFLLLARLMTLNQKETAFSETFPKDSAFYPVTLPASEGFEVARVVLGDISPARQKTLPVIKDLSLSLLSSALVYVPFTLKGQEYIQPELNFSVMANALKWGRML